MRRSAAVFVPALFVALSTSQSWADSRRPAAGKQIAAEPVQRLARDGETFAPRSPTGRPAARSHGYAMPGASAACPPCNCCYCVPRRRGPVSRVIRGARHTAGFATRVITDLHPGFRIADGWGLIDTRGLVRWIRGD